MSKDRLVWVVVALFAALVGGWFLSNFLIPFFLGLQGVPQAWNLWWQYFHALSLPQLAPYVARIKFTGAIGFGLPLLIWVGLLIPLLKAKSESLHGDARFAELADLRKAGLLKQTAQSTLIGKYKGHYLWLSGAEHVICISPTRSGKTTSIAIPVLQRPQL